MRHDGEKMIHDNNWRERNRRNSKNWRRGDNGNDQKPAGTGRDQQMARSPDRQRPAGKFIEKIISKEKIAKLRGPEKGCQKESDTWMKPQTAISPCKREGGNRNSA